MCLPTALDIVIGGLIMGGIYALIAVGLSLQYGVGRVLNVSHGEFIMVGAFITYSLYAIFGISPWDFSCYLRPFSVHHRFCSSTCLSFNTLETQSESLDAFEGSSLLSILSAFLFIIQNIALLIWKANVRGYIYLTTSVSILGAVFPANRLTALLFAVVISLAFYIFLKEHTPGKSDSSRG